MAEMNDDLFGNLDSKMDFLNEQILKMQFFKKEQRC
jgi:hypothetical protein